MSVYKLELSKHALKILEAISKKEHHIYLRVARALDELEKDPFQGKPLKGELHGRYSYRVGTYRIIYLIHRHELLVLVIDVGHRRDIYRS